MENSSQALMMKMKIFFFDLLGWSAYLRYTSIPQNALTQEEYQEHWQCLQEFDAHGHAFLDEMNFSYSYGCLLTRYSIGRRWWMLLIDRRQRIPKFSRIFLKE
uniref:Uncharacterized protein n=1 Tax=Johnson-sea-linkia profunda TaxID=575876 RepID=A0A386AXQ4_9CHLO|nr:hypothetical protein [Johnson-sea-linkia profunda]